MENNMIFVGSKPVMNYVLAVVTQFNEGSNSVMLRARGKCCRHCRNSKKQICTGV